MYNLQPPKGLGQLLSGLGQPQGEGTDRRMDVRMYGHTDSPCILQDFVSSGSLWSRCPAYMIATITKYQSRARVPMTNSCLWATGYHQKRYFLITEINGKWVIQTHTRARMKPRVCTRKFTFKMMVFTMPSTVMLILYHCFRV